MYIRSVLFSFSEAALKRQPRTTEAEIKLLMCWNSLKCTWQYMVAVEKWPRKQLIGKCMFNFEFTVMQELDYKE